MPEGPGRVCVSWPDASVLPRLERVLERSMIVCLLGLLRTERLAREMSAVTRVMEILQNNHQHTITDDFSDDVLLISRATKQ